MERITFDLRRPPFVAFDEESGRDSAERHGRREKERRAGHEPFGLPHVGKDLFRRLARARRHAGKGERRAHQLEEGPARDWIGDRLDLRRGLVREPLAERGIVRALVERPPEGPGFGIRDSGFAHR